MPTDKPHRVVRLIISSGAGDQRIRQAVFLYGHGNTISPRALHNGERLLRDWALREYPDRKDWEITQEQITDAD